MWVPCKLLRLSSVLAAASVLIFSSGSFSQTVTKQAVPTQTVVVQVSAPNTGKQVLDHVELAMRWYRQWENADMFVVRSADELYIENGQAIARQAMKLEFQSALAEATIIGEKSGKASHAHTGTPSTVDAQNIFQALQSIEPQIQTLKNELDTVNRKILQVSAKKRPPLLAQRDTLQGQIQLALALQGNLQKLTSFMTLAEDANGATTELTGKIRGLEKTVPALQTVVAPVQAGAGVKSQSAPKIVSAPAPVTNAQGAGLVGQLGQMFHLISSLRALDQLSDATAQMQTSTLALRAPLLIELRAILREGQLEIQNVTANSGAGPNGAQPAQLSGSHSQQPAQAATGIPAPLQAGGQQSPRSMQLLVQRFKLLSDATMPLSQQLILIDQSQANLTQLQNSMEREYTAIMRSVLLRVAMIFLSLGLIWLFSELWRRASFRYIRDARRRHQFLVLRRVVTGFCMGIVIILGFVSEFSSLATYAGLITAGVAVALQTVILSVAAYFFLVGRYGVRVGDRITVVYSGAIGVSGEVLDIGLVRFYMLEMTGSGIDMQPTGRICVFPNSVLFQTTPLFKQIPGTEYTWRELALPLHPECDVQLAEKDLLAAVDAIYAEYRPLLEKQHHSVEHLLDVHMDVPKPYTRVRFSATGLEAVVRYPIPLRQAAQMDDRMVIEMTEILRKNPTIRLAVGGVPELRSAIKN